MLKIEYFNYICKALSKASGVCVRMYKDKNLLYSHSVFTLEPDPVILHLDEILNNTHSTGVIATPLFQFYGFFDITTGHRIVIGPYCILTEDKKQLDNILFLLNIPTEKHEEYIQSLNCMPPINVGRASWMISFLYTSINGIYLPVEDVHLNLSDNIQKNIGELNSQETLSHLDESLDTIDISDSYKYENFIVFCVKHGQVDKLREVINAAPKVKPGKMASDTLRQHKNMGICAATVFSRAAIDGGLSKEIAFKLSDLYIQKFELINNGITISKLIDEMILEFAARVKSIKYNFNQDSHLFEQCSHYITQNIFTKITVQDIADKLGFSRTYLCNQFKKQTGITLSQYILNLKISESQRLLQFTNKSLIDIALHLNFASQSHFQISFKKNNW